MDSLNSQVHNCIRGLPLFISAPSARQEIEIDPGCQVLTCEFAPSSDDLIFKTDIYCTTEKNERKQYCLMLHLSCSLHQSQAHVLFVFWFSAPQIYVIL
jgi:hypothetical protein